MPGAIIGKLCNRLRQVGAGSVWLAEEQGRHAPVEEDWHAVRQRLPDLQGLLALTAMPRQGGLLVGEGGLPLGGDRRSGFLQQSSGPIKVPTQAKGGHGQQDFREGPVLLRPVQESLGRDRPTATGRSKVG